MPRKKKKQSNIWPYRSKYERDVCGDLDARKVKYDYEPTVLLYEVPARMHKYTPDVVLDNGIIVELKGKFTAADRKKMVLVIEQNPDLDIRMLFMRNNTLTKISKTRYTDWCDKRGIKCAVGREIPKEWIDA